MLIEFVVSQSVKWRIWQQYTGYDENLINIVGADAKSQIRFEWIQDIEAATTTQLETLTKEDFQNCSRKWQERWDKCVRSEGEYFEGD